MHNIFTEEVNKIPLSSNHEKITQSRCYRRKHKKKHNQEWPQIPDHSYIMLIIGSGETNSLFI